jgi:hypothetical protein
VAAGGKENLLLEEVNSEEVTDQLALSEVAGHFGDGLTGAGGLARCP